MSISHSLIFLPGRKSTHKSQSCVCALYPPRFCSCSSTSLFALLSTSPPNKEQSPVTSRAHHSCLPMLPPTFFSVFQPPRKQLLALQPKENASPLTLSRFFHAKAFVPCSVTSRYNAEEPRRTEAAACHAQQGRKGPRRGNCECPHLLQ